MEKISFLLKYIRAHTLSYALGVFFIVVTNWVAVIIPEYIQKSMDLLSDQLAQNEELLAEYIMTIMGLAISMIVIRTLSRIFFFTPGRAIECEIKNDMFAKLMELQKDYHDKNPSGTVISKLNNDVNGIRLLCGFAMMQAFNIISALSLTPFMMWKLSPRLTLYCVIPIILVFTIVRIGMRYLVKNMRERMVALQDLSGFTVSALSGIDVIKSFGMARWVENEFDKENKEMLKRSLNISWVRSFLISVLNNMENILKTLILLVGGIFVIEEQFTIGELTAFITYAGLLTMPLMGLGWVSTMLQQGMVGLESVQTIMKEESHFHKIPSLPAKESHSLFGTGLEIRNLNYHYPGQDQATLHSIDFHILPGQTIGILGRIGSGKTTLVNCLNRYLTVGDQQVWIGGQDINTLSNSDLRGSIRTVTQDPFLFSDTVDNNITFGKQEHEDDNESANLEQLLFECALSEEVQRFPLQEKTLVGEKGIMLSGGQKQRISLARAMIAHCDLLILDNVLSAVDAETESFLLQQILRKQHAQSLLIVSHRAKSMEKADWILILEDGKIVDQGTHSELLGRPGYYQKTWMLQNEMTTS
ncbi:MAG: ABC transporter ATP-binding protein [SAR324 cluster bacterium]|nr:ABC transporter ATP-binding protein [SAR324 cluster bacterium]